MKFLLFDQRAVEILVSASFFQSTEYLQGSRFVQHVCGELHSEILEDIIIEYYNGGILFVGKKAQSNLNDSELKIYCIDLLTCNILSEREKPDDLLTVLQKSFRTVMKIWNRQPFTSSERIHGSKSIIFPFVFTDQRRIVIERSNEVPRLIKRGIKSPLLAYKYNADNPPQGEEVADTSVLREAGELYYSEHIGLQKRLESKPAPGRESGDVSTLAQVTATSSVKGEGFIYYDYDTQLLNLTETQRFVVEYPDINSPLRVDGAAGTGKTASLIMRAYNLLCQHKQKGADFSIVFFAHSESTNRRNKETFELYSDSDFFLNDIAPQRICFTTLFEFCRKFAGMSIDTLAEQDAGDAKTYQLLLIENVIDKAENSNKIRTYKPLLSKELGDVFDLSRTTKNALYAMLQHEFSIQIKGRTDCTIDTYYDIPSISNGLPCKSKKDKEFIFSLFNDYQNMLKIDGSFDIDDVIIEAMSHLNAPVWRRERTQNGYDYILVDEMHLFNINEQSIFHHLTKSLGQKDIPICFALDYSQAIGDRGNTSIDYIEKAFGSKIQKRNYRTIFRNSPQIADFCASIAASGTLMFRYDFSNPYNSTASNFTEKEEKKSSVPVLHMYNNNDNMLTSLHEHIGGIIKDLQCKPNELAVISFDTKLVSDDGVDQLNNITEKKFTLLDSNRTLSVKDCILASPYAINGLEFQAVILVGVDEGRVPQTVGVSDISKHFVQYSAYNLLYLSSSRAKYKLILLGNKLNGVSSCLDHSLKSGYLILEEH